MKPVSVLICNVDSAAQFQFRNRSAVELTFFGKQNRAVKFHRLKFYGKLVDGSFIENGQSFPGSILKSRGM
jgi:hypothetical protein